MRGIVIEEGEQFYTDLKGILNMLGSSVTDYNWLISGYECYPQDSDISKIFKGNPVIISHSEMYRILEKENFQWIWGVFSAIKGDISKEEIFSHPIPFAEGNSNIWKVPVSIQHPLAEIEIVAWDSSESIVICKDDALIDSISKCNTYSITMKEYID